MRWFCVVGVRLRRPERREKETKTKKNESFGRVQKRKNIWRWLQKPTIFRKSEKRARKNISVVLKIRSKSSALFISFRLGAEKTSEPTTRVNSVLKARFYSRPKSPLLLPIRKNKIKEEGITDFWVAFNFGRLRKKRDDTLWKERQNSEREGEFRSKNNLITRSRSPFFVSLPERKLE